jgi:hypothetical protein
MRAGIEPENAQRPDPGTGARLRDFKWV